MSTQVDPQSVDVGGAQPVTQAYRLPDPEHCGAVAGQTVAQPPQLAGLLISVSQPSLAFAEQCIQPAAHDDSGTEHAPALQAAGPFTFFSDVQSWPQLPQFLGSVCVFVHVTPQLSGVAPEHLADASPSAPASSGAGWEPLSALASGDESFARASSGVSSVAPSFAAASNSAESEAFARPASSGAVESSDAAVASIPTTGMTTTGLAPSAASLPASIAAENGGLEHRQRSPPSTTTCRRSPNLSFRIEHPGCLASSFGRSPRKVATTARRPSTIAAR